MTYEQKEKQWDLMTEDEKLLAYAKAKLRGARFRDSIPRFKREGNESNLWYEMRTEFVYGQG